MSEPESPSEQHPRRRLRAAHQFLWDLNNLLLIPVLSFIMVDLVAVGLGVQARDIDGLEPINAVICAFFFTEWLLGLVLSEDRGAYLRKPARVADLVSSLPIGYFLQGVRLMRLFRVLRLFRVVWRMRRIRGKLRQILHVSGLVSAVAVSGAIALRMLEPQTVTTFGEAMWWSIVTMSTVGYGDISPTTTAGRAVAMTMIIVGIAIFGYAVSVLTSVMVEQDEGESLEAILRRIEARLEGLESRVGSLRSPGG